MVEYTLTPADLAAFAAWRSAVAGDDDPRRRRLRVAGAWLAGSLTYVALFAVLVLPPLLSLDLVLAAVLEVVVLAGGLA